MTSTTDFYTRDPSVHQQLRALNKEYRDTQEALNHTQASLNRAMKLMEENYHRKRKQILNGNGHDEEDRLCT
jgi:hypothetical protein